MSAQRLNAAERDLEKFIKFLVLKSTQVVVQSRLGEKMQTQCNPLAGSDWFNIAVHDHPEVLDETKRALNLKTGESILQRLPLCVEISLKTAEGDQMVLEVWSLDLIPPQNGSSPATNDLSPEGQTLKAAHAIYNRMGIMLKSLISLTRTTPAYKLSRRQCPDSYGIFYRIYVDRPQVHTLGEGHKHVKIGQLSTIVGSLVMSVAYRTKLTISPTAAQAESNTIMLKSDHFRPATDNGSPGNQQQLLNGTAVAKKLGLGGLNPNQGSADRRYIDIEKPLRPGAFADMGKLKQYTEDDFVLPETPPFEWLLRGRGSVESLNRLDNNTAPSVLSSNNNNNPQDSKFNPISNLNNNSTGFKSFEKNSGNSVSPIKSLLIPASVTATYRHHSEPALQPPHDDDNLLKELHFPFASPTSHVNDLAKFYRECYHAPPLKGLNELQAEISSISSTPPASSGSGGGVSCGPTAAATAIATSAADASAMDDLSRQLEQFETSLEDYDKLVSQFGLTGSSSTGSRSSGGLQMSN
ncbi:autophagy-related protein 13 homolog [Drosophila subpulchrella]|uniref:autophagy-related protein 13 homolog n=1 Tax=Drosophila subpulchrella TaxID=1486046 RepID=UPI0018A1AFBF|nr:autophagy-related protein 13 homolog [Drosophila subpulchrella]